MHIQIYVQRSPTPFAICKAPEEVDAVLTLFQPEMAQVVVFLEFPLQGTVTRVETGKEVVHLRIGKHRQRFDRQTGTETGPDRIGVSCTSRGGDVVPVDTVNLKFSADKDELTDHGIVRVHGGTEATASVTLYPQRIAIAGEKPSEILELALTEVVDRLLKPFMNK